MGGREDMEGMQDRDGDWSEDYTERIGAWDGCDGYRVFSFQRMGEGRTRTIVRLRLGANKLGDDSVREAGLGRNISLELEHWE